MVGENAFSRVGILNVNALTRRGRTERRRHPGRAGREVSGDGERSDFLLCLQAARAWIKQKSKAKAADTATKGLTAAREEKVRLECEILTLRLERERDNVELISVREVQKFIRSFVSYMRVVLVFRAESLVNEIMGKSEMEMYRALRDLFNKTLFHGVLGYTKGGGQKNPDPRLVAYAEKCLDEECGWWARGEWAADQERNLVALIKWAQEEQP